MTRRIRFVLLVAIVMLGFVGGWASAQSIGAVPVAPTVLSGDKIGFRVEGYRGNVAVGKLVVQVDGKWVEAEYSAGVRKLTQR